MNCSVKDMAVARVRSRAMVIVTVVRAVAKVRAMTKLGLGQTGQ